MNVKAYISSGIVESYVLGLATPDERREFESYCAAYPEIAAARDAFERSLEASLLADATPPPAFLKEKIRQAALEEKQTDTVTASPATVRSINPWKWMAAACLLLLAGSVYWGYNQQQSRLALVQQKQELEQSLQLSREELANRKEEAALLQKPGVLMAAMKASNNPLEYATIYWDTASRDVFLMINNLPQPPSGHQYQLWALLNNQPIDLGMIEVKQQRLLYRMKNVREAQAFAITIEPKGGSTVPTTSPLVMSKL